MADNEEGRICQSCGYEETENTKITDYPNVMGHDGLKTVQYCWLCASTLASTRTRYNSPDGDLLAHVCFVGNTILDAIAKT